MPQQNNRPTKFIMLKSIRNHSAALLAAAGCLAIAVPAHAGDAGKAVSSNQNPEITIGVDAGIWGYGGTVNWRFADHFGIRAGGHYAEYSQSQTIKGIDYSATARMQSETVGLDVYPWADTSFRITLGALYNQNELTATASPVSGNITIAGQTFSSSDVGHLNLKIRQQPVDPYLAVGGNLFYFDDSHQWAFTGELGVVYVGDAKVNLDRSKRVATPVDDQINDRIAKEKKQIEGYANWSKFWPIASIGVSYTF